MKRVEGFKCDIVEPMMSTTIPIYVVVTRVGGAITRVVIQPEGGYKIDMRRLSLEEFTQLFKD